MRHEATASQSESPDRGWTECQTGACG
jgi:hypothetical protein